MPAVQPCEGSPRSAACTASRSASVGWKGSPVGRPSAVRTVTRSECPPSLSTWAGVNPAAARRWIISLTACPVIAVAPMAPMACTPREQRPGRVGRFEESGAAAAVLHLENCPVLSPADAGCCGLPAEDGHHRPAAAVRGGAVPRLQDLPPAHVGAGRAGHRVPPVREGLDRAVGLLVGLGPAQPHMQAVRGGQGDVFEGERDQFGAAVRAGEPHQQQRHVPAGGHPRRPATRLRRQRCQQQPDVVQVARARAGFVGWPGCGGSRTARGGPPRSGRAGPGRRRCAPG